MDARHPAPHAADPAPRSLVEEGRQARLETSEPGAGTQPAPVEPVETRLTRRRALLTTAWSAPAIVAASATPAYAAGGMSPGLAPAITVSGLNGVRRDTPGETDLIDVTATFTNDGGAATALSAQFEWVVVGMGQASNTVSDVSSPWTAGAPGFGLGFQRTFTRAGGLGAGASDTLTFTFQSFGGRGTISVAPPTTTPTGVNAGTAGTWGDNDTIDMDVTGVSSPLDNGQIFISLKNNGPLPIPRHVVEVVITPTTGTVGLTGGGSPTNMYAVSQATVAPQTAPMTIRFTRNLPLAAGASVSFNFGIDQTGSGTISAKVVDPDSPNNATGTGNYL